MSIKSINFLVAVARSQYLHANDINYVQIGSLHNIANMSIKSILPSLARNICIYIAIPCAQK